MGDVIFGRFPNSNPAEAVSNVSESFDYEAVHDEYVQANKIADTDTRSLTARQGLLTSRSLTNKFVEIELLNDRNTAFRAERLQVVGQAIPTNNNSSAIEANNARIAQLKSEIQQELANLK